MQKLSHKSMIILHKSCSALNKETNKIGFLIFWFFCEFIWSLQDAGKTQK
jgi:hypothetical protein